MFREAGDSEMGWNSCPSHTAVTCSELLQIPPNTKAAPEKMKCDRGEPSSEAASSYGCMTVACLGKGRKNAPPPDCWANELQNELHELPVSDIRSNAAQRPSAAQEPWRLAPPKVPGRWRSPGAPFLSDDPGAKATEVRLCNDLEMGPRKSRTTETSEAAREPSKTLSSRVRASSPGARSSSRQMVLPECTIEGKPGWP